MRRYLLAFLSSIGLPLWGAYACDLCAVYNFVESQSGTSGSLNTGLAYQLTHLESNVRARGFEDFPGQHLDSNVWQLYSSYSVSDALAFQMNIPLIYRDYRRITRARVEEGSESGLGDISLLARYAPIRTHDAHSSFRLETFGGLKLPTGDTDPLSEEADAFTATQLRHSSEEGNLVGGDELALGSGSYDFLFGGNLFWQLNRFYALGSAQYTLRQEGDYDYEYGDDFQWHFGPAYYLLLDDDHTFSLRVRVSGDTKGDDQVGGRTVDGSSDTNAYVGPELSYSVGSRWYARAGVDFPVKTESAAETVVPRVRVVASLIYRFRT